MTIQRTDTLVPLSTQGLPFDAVNPLAAPIATSTFVIDANTVGVNFNMTVDDSGGSSPYTGDAEILDCAIDLLKTITGVSGNGTTQLAYTVTEAIASGDDLRWSAGGITAKCELHDLTVGNSVNNANLYGFAIAAHPNGPFGNITPKSGELTNVYSLTFNIANDEIDLRLGANGDEKDQGGNDSLEMTFGGYGTVTATWDAVNLWYDIVDAALVSYIQSVEGETIVVGVVVSLDTNLIPIGNDRTFDTGLGNWYNGIASAGSTNWNSGLQAIDIVSDGTTGFPRGVLLITTEIGVDYIAQCELISVSAGDTLLAVVANPNGSGAISTNIPMGVPGVYLNPFTALATTTYISLLNNSGSNDSRVSVIDNISLVKV